MGFLNRLTKLFTRESLDQLSAAVGTSQNAFDTEQRNFLLPSVGLIPPFNLTEYLSLYLSDDLAHAVIDADTELTSSPIECVSDDDALCDAVNEFNRRIDLDSITRQIIQDVNISGFALFEIVGNGSSLLDSTQILGLHRLDPRFLIIQKTKQGRFEFFRQRPGFSCE